MKVIWSYESNDGEIPNFCKAEIYVIAASVSFWKKLNPSDTTIFFVDETSKPYFDKLKITRLFDEVRILPKNEEINKNVFWASSKIRALSLVESPVLHLDLDFFTWTRFSDLGLFDKYVAAAFEEDTRHFYQPVDVMLKGIFIPSEKPIKSMAYNTFLMYFGTDIIKNEFCNLSLDYMIKASKKYDESIHKKDNSYYMIFAEQQLFANVAHQKNFPIKTILKEKIVPGTNRVIKSNRNKKLGIYTEAESYNHLVHLGNFKIDLRKKDTYQTNVINHILDLSKSLDVRF